MNKETIEGNKKFKNTAVENLRKQLSAHQENAEDENEDDSSRDFSKTNLEVNPGRYSEGDSRQNMDREGNKGNPNTPIINK